METISLQILNVGIDIHCANKEIKDLLLKNFGAIQSNNTQSSSIDCIKYTVDSDGPELYKIIRDNQPYVGNADVYDLIYFLEKAITVELQKARKDLLFLHGAALAIDNKACLIVAPSGSGKSTTTWALLHHGFSYLSDELAPIALQSMKVAAYPHALCLKADPPESYSLPSDVIRTAATIHVPVEQLPARVCSNPTPLVAIFFLKFTHDHNEPSIQPITSAEASARIYANALNPLAHPEGGLDAGIEVAKSNKCFNVISADLEKTARLLKSVMSEL